MIDHEANLKLLNEMWPPPDGLAWSMRDPNEGVDEFGESFDWYEYWLGDNSMFAVYKDGAVQFEFWDDYHVFASLEEAVQQVQASLRYTVRTYTKLLSNVKE